jgi:hypothetical protein
MTGHKTGYKHPSGGKNLNVFNGRRPCTGERISMDGLSLARRPRTGLGLPSPEHASAPAAGAAPVPPCDASRERPRRTGRATT